MRPEEVDGSGQPAGDRLWQHCDLRYFAPAGLVAKGTKHLLKRLALDCPMIPAALAAVTLGYRKIVLTRGRRLLEQLGDEALANRTSVGTTPLSLIL